MTPHEIVFAAIVTLTACVAVAGRMWLAPEPYAPRHAGTVAAGAGNAAAYVPRHSAPVASPPREKRVRREKLLSARDASTVALFQAMRATQAKVVAAPDSLRRRIDALLADPSETAPYVAESDDDWGTRIVDVLDSTTAADDALGAVRVSRVAADDLARTWDADRIPDGLVSAVYPYADPLDLDAAWVMFRDATLKADALEHGTEHWSAWYSFEALGNQPAGRAVELALAEADDAFAGLVGGPGNTTLVLAGAR